MTAAEIRAHQKQRPGKDKDPTTWFIEVAAQIAEMNELLRQVLEQSVKPKADRRKTRTRSYYAIEYVPALPVKIDRLVDGEPKERWHHKVIARTRDEAMKKLVTRLTKEREEEQEALRRAIPDEPKEQEAKA